MTDKEKKALIIILEFVEKWNKQDKDIRVAESAEVLWEVAEEV